MINNSNDVLLQEKMEQMMNDIYETLRGLFFNHIHEALPPFERFKVPEIRLSDEIKAKTFGKYSLEEVIEKIKSVRVLGDRRTNTYRRQSRKQMVNIRCRYY